MILEDSRLLPAGEVGLSKFLAQRPDDSGVVVDVQLQLAGHLPGNPQVALSNRLPCTFAQPTDRQQPV